VDLQFQQGRFVATNLPLRWLIAVAYAEEGREPNLDRIVGGPPWIDSVPFDIQATTNGPATPTATMRLMVQTLLKERFGLRMHTEQRSLPAYALLLNRDDGRLGPKLRPAETKTCSDLTLEQSRERRCGSGVYFDKEEQVAVVYGSNADIDALIDHIASPAVAAVDRPVVNRTGLSGRFDYELRFSIAAGRVDPSPAVGLNPSGPPIFTSLREQLGLRLDPVTAPTEVLVIDSVQQPTEN
jgi:uncharacterized protein (TIGR03435 family)